MRDCGSQTRTVANHGSVILVGWSGATLENMADGRSGTCPTGRQTESLAHVRRLGMCALRGG
jgi:hypothetical protein